MSVKEKIMGRLGGIITILIAIFIGVLVIIAGIGHGISNSFCEKDCEEEADRRYGPKSTGVSNDIRRWIWEGQCKFFCRVSGKEA
jgi:hypothetical protein